MGGEALALPWHSKEQAINLLCEWQVLDEGSADFLSKATNQDALNIVSALTPDVRNPSAFVTRKMKELQRAGGITAPGKGQPLHESYEEIQFYYQGSAQSLLWSSKEDVLSELMAIGMLDERRQTFLCS